MASTPTVTVLVPTYNREDFLAECLDSILSQTLAPSQIIVINDGSTDHTLEVLEPYRDRIEYIETPQLGKPAAINAGLERVTGEYLWIFDDDDVALPEALARFVEPLENHPEHGFSYSTFYYTASRPQDNRIGPILHESGVRDLHEWGFLIPLLEANFLGGAALFARTSCYACVGNFDSGSCDPRTTRWPSGSPAGSAESASRAARPSTIASMRDCGAAPATASRSAHD